MLLLFVSFPLLSDELQTAPMNPPDIGLAADPAPGEVTGGLREGSHVTLFLPNLPYLAISHARMVQKFERARMVQIFERAV